MIVAWQRPFEKEKRKKKRRKNNLLEEGTRGNDRLVVGTDAAEGTSFVDSYTENCFHTIRAWIVHDQIKVLLNDEWNRMTRPRCVCT